LHINLVETDYLEFTISTTLTQFTERYATYKRLHDGKGRT